MQLAGQMLSHLQIQKGKAQVCSSSRTPCPVPKPPSLALVGQASGLETGLQSSSALHLLQGQNWPVETKLALSLGSLIVLSCLSPLSVQPPVSPKWPPPSPYPCPLNFPAPIGPRLSLSPGGRRFFPAYEDKMPGRRPYSIHCTCSMGFLPLALFQQNWRVAICKVIVPLRISRIIEKHINMWVNPSKYWLYKSL